MVEGPNARYIIEDSAQNLFSDIGVT